MQRSAEAAPKTFEIDKPLDAALQKQFTTNQLLAIYASLKVRSRQV